MGSCRIEGAHPARHHNRGSGHKRPFDPVAPSPNMLCHRLPAFPHSRPAGSLKVVRKRRFTACGVLPAELFRSTRGSSTVPIASSRRTPAHRAWRASPLSALNTSPHASADSRCAKAEAARRVLRSTKSGSIRTRMSPVVPSIARSARPRHTTLVPGEFAINPQWEACQKVFPRQSAR